MAEVGAGGNPALMVFSDDWGRHPSSCQHLVRRLLPRYRACWVNTIGTRRPRLDRATLNRVLEKLRHWLMPRKERQPLPENLRVVSPLMWPWFSRSIHRRLNCRLLAWRLVPLVRSSPQPVIAVTTLPLVADLMEVLPVVRWVYYCVDDFSQWPGVDQQAMLQMERQLVRRADVLVAAGHALQDRLARWGRAAQLLTHGVDLEHWRAPREPTSLPQLDGLERPLVLFWGLVDRRMDVEFVDRTAATLGRGTVLLVGPEADPDPALDGIDRVKRLPGVAYEQLPHLAREADVLIMPYADLPVTRAMQPLKMTEYLATGKPAVVRDLPAARPWADAMDLAAAPEEFAAAVCRRLAEGISPAQIEARRRLERESWDAKARQFERMALELDPVKEPAAETVDEA